MGETRYPISYRSIRRVNIQLQAHLREHPEAIRIDDPEYALIYRVVIWLEEFFTSPSDALNALPQNETIELGP